MGGPLFDRIFCLIASTFACVCRIKRNKCNYEVVVGTHNLSVATSEETRHLIRKVVIHDGYDNGNLSWIYSYSDV